MIKDYNSYEKLMEILRRSKRFNQLKFQHNSH
jgi:hypothetical protein